MAKFNYKKSGPGATKRPLIEMKVFSKKFEKWITFRKVLADTGADISLLPKYLGTRLIPDYTNGEKHDIRGIAPHPP